MFFYQPISFFKVNYFKCIVNLIIYSLFTVGFRDYLWIGGNDIENEGDWKWISKQVTYMNVTGEERNMNGNFCIALRPSDGLWNVTVCDVGSSFPLCEIQETSKCGIFVKQIMHFL